MYFCLLMLDQTQYKERAKIKIYWKEAIAFDSYVFSKVFETPPDKQNYFFAASV